MAFWRELDAEARKAVHQLPPLTDEMVAACETKFGVRFPPALLHLLRSQNGGLLENTDFKFHGKDCGVTGIRGIDDGEGFSCIRPCSDFMDESDPLGGDLVRQLRKKAGDPARLLCFADDEVHWYALDYNHLNSKGEPTILRVLTDEDTANCWRVADSVAGFLQGQYFGDPEPSVQLKEADKLKLIAEGGYTGKSRVNRTPVQISWKICSQRSRIIVLSSEDWGIDKEGPELRRAELLKGNLCFGGQLSEENAAELGPELTDLIRPHVEAESIEKYDIGVTPTCYLLRLDIQPQGKWVKVQDSKPYKGKWKNSSDEVVYTRVFSADKAALRRAMIAVAESCQGLRRFLG